MVSVKHAKIILLIYQIFSILGEIIILILSNDKEEIELFGTQPPTTNNVTSPNSNNSTPTMSSTTTTITATSTTTTSSTTTTNLYNQQQAYQDSLIVAEKLNKAINLAITTNSLLPHNQIISKINQTSNNKRKVIVVSLDGGGIKGIVTLTMLMELQKQMSGIDIIDNADMVCGTSTGSIIAMGRSKPLPYSEIFDIYKRFGKAIFKTPVKNLIVGATLANSDKKTEELIKVFGTSTMGTFSQDKKVFVVTSKLKNNNNQTTSFPQVVQQQLVNQSSPASTSLQQQQLQQQQLKQQQHEDFKTKIISNYNKKYSNVRVTDALDASSAAPIFFKPVEIQGHKYIDGGVGLENNPVLLAHKECQKLYNDRETEYLFISLGTGIYGQPSSSNSSGGSSNKIIFQAQETFKNAVGLIKNAASSIGDSETTHQIFKQMINYKNVSYYRFNPKLSQNFSLSDTSSSSLAAMENETKAYMNSSDMIREVQTLKNEIYSIISFKKGLQQ